MIDVEVEDVMTYFERAVSVDALRVLIAAAVVGETLVDVAAHLPVSGETFATRALVAADGVVAVRVRVAIERSHQALVVVRATGAFVWFHRVSVLAAAFVRTQCVVALAIFAHVPSSALVNIFKTTFNYEQPIASMRALPSQVEPSSAIVSPFSQVHS